MPSHTLSVQPRHAIARVRTLTIAALTTATIGFTSVALAQGGPSPAELQIKYRQGAYTVIGGNFAPLGAMVSGKRPWDAKNAALRAERVAFVAQIAAEAFPDGSGAGTQAVPTKAKPEIWTNRAEFDKLMKDMVDKTAALAKVAKTGNQDKIKAAFGAAGQTCKACHDKFKME
jgi:cytochrome c556